MNVSCRRTAAVFLPTACSFNKQRFRVPISSLCSRSECVQPAVSGSFGQQLPDRRHKRCTRTGATAIATKANIKAKTAEKLAWVQTTNMAVLTSAVESGINTFLFPAEHQHLAQDWQGVVAFDALVCDGDSIRNDNHQFESGWTDPPGCVRFGYASSSQGLQ